jgi:hypothetical protein
MKYYIVEPSYKKSFVETTAFKRIDENGNQIWLRKELGWRWGSFLFSVPETVEEAMTFLKDQGYDEVLDWAYDYGHTITDDNGDEVIDPDADIVSMVVQQFLPNVSDDFVDVTEDYPNAEFIEAWDGCWESWSVSSYQTEIDEEEQEAIIEEVTEAYEEGYEEAVEELGWEFVDTYFEIQCNPQITPCDEDGNKFEESVD